MPEPPADQDRLVAVEDDAGHALPVLSARVLRRLMCTGARTVVDDADGEVIDVRDERRIPNAKQRMRLLLRERGCRFPGFTMRRGLHARHIVHWEDGGPTELYNLVLLCATHHRFVHDHGWTIAHDGLGRLAFTPPDAEPVPTCPPLPAAVVPELVFPEWADELDGEVDPWMVRPGHRCNPKACSPGPTTTPACSSSIRNSNASARPTSRTSSSQHDRCRGIATAPREVRASFSRYGSCFGTRATAAVATCGHDAPAL